MRLAHLTLGPTIPAFVFWAYSLIRAQDYRVEDAVAQSLLAQCQPSRRPGGGEELAAGCHVIEVFADDGRVEERLPVVGHEARNLHQRVLQRQRVIALNGAEGRRQQLDAVDKPML